MRFCSISSGSKGNCIYCGNENTNLLIDVGVSGKKVSEGAKELSLSLENVDGILITHEHSDHVKGLGVISRKYNIPVFATEETIRAILNIKSLGAIDKDLFNVIEANNSFLINDLEIMPYSLPHDAANPVGYTVTHKNKKIGIATDLGYVRDNVIEVLQDVDACLIEANHDENILLAGDYPYNLKQRILGKRGHLSNEACGYLLNEIFHSNLKYVLLGHLSQENNYHELALKTVQQAVEYGKNSLKAKNIKIEIASQDRISKIINI